jgi:hypothetical protein
MRNAIILTVFAVFALLSASAQKKETVKVWGNCGMCEKTIETAAKSAGAVEADWNKETKMLSVSHNSSLAKIEQAIAAAGYDTERYTAPDEAYFKLHSCCQYDRKSASAESKAAHGDCCKGGKCEKGEKGEKCMKGDKGSCAGCEQCASGTCTKHGKDGKGGSCCKKA